MRTISQPDNDEGSARVRVAAGGQLRHGNVMCGRLVEKKLAMTIELGVATSPHRPGVPAGCCKSAQGVAAGSVLAKDIHSWSPIPIQ